MIKVSKYGRCEPVNVERDLESVRICDVGLNAASRAYARRKVIAEGQLVKIIFTFGAIQVLYNDH
jgi:ribosomal protein S8E